MVRYGFQNEQEAAFPAMIHLVVTNACNIKCAHCAYSVISSERGFRPTHLDWNLFVHVIEETTRHPGSILRFTCDGEPLMNPRFVEMVAYAKSQGISPVTVNTNGILLDKKKIEGLLKAGIDLVEVSINAFSRERYFKLRLADNYEQVVANTYYLLEARQKIRGCPTKVMVSIIDQEPVKEELEPFVAHWTPLVDKVIVRRYTSYGGIVPGPREEGGEEAGRYPCFVLWRRFTVNSLGQTRFCFNDWYNQSIIGDLKDGLTIAQVWQSQVYEELRRRHLERNFHLIPYCANCTTWRVLKWEDEYGGAIKELCGE